MGYPIGQVDIPGLAKAGADVSHAGEAFGRVFSGHVDALAPGTAWTGWAAGAVMGDAVRAWSTFVGNLTKQVAAFGTDLSQTADAYRTADQQAADRVGGVGAGLPAGGFGQVPW